jgi:hypothetical protein
MRRLAIAALAAFAATAATASAASPASFRQVAMTSEAQFTSQGALWEDADGAWHMFGEPSAAPRDIPLPPGCRLRGLGRFSIVLELCPAGDGNALDFFSITTGRRALLPVHLTSAQTLDGFGKYWMSVRDCGATVTCDAVAVNWRTGERRARKNGRDLNDPRLGRLRPLPDVRSRHYRLRYRSGRLVLITPAGRQRTIDRCPFGCTARALTHGMAVWVKGGVVKTMLLGRDTEVGHRLAADPSPGSREIGLIASVTATRVIVDAPGAANERTHPLYAASLSELRGALRRRR